MFFAFPEAKKKFAQIVKIMARIKRKIAISRVYGKSIKLICLNVDMLLLLLFVVARKQHRNRHRGRGNETGEHFFLRANMLLLNIKKKNVWQKNGFATNKRHTHTHIYKYVENKYFMRRKFRINLGQVAPLAAISAKTVRDYEYWALDWSLWDITGCFLLHFCFQIRVQPVICTQLAAGHIKLIMKPIDFEQRSRQDKRKK